MSKWTIVMIVAVTAVLTMLTGNIARFIGKSHGAASMTAKSTELSESECVERYAVTAAAEFGVRAARFMCAEIHNPATTTERQNVIGCVLPLLADARNELAVKLAISNCNGKFMPAPAPAGIAHSPNESNFFDRPELKRNFFESAPEQDKSTPPSSGHEANPYRNPYSDE